MGFDSESEAFVLVFKKGDKETAFSLGSDFLIEITDWRGFKEAHLAEHAAFAAQVLSLVQNKEEVDGNSEPKAESNESVGAGTVSNQDQGQ